MSFCFFFFTYPYLAKTAQFFRYLSFKVFLVPKINKKDKSVVAELNKLRRKDLECWAPKLHWTTYGKLLNLLFRLLKQKEIAKSKKL